MISIIVPVYNVEKYLRRCLDSIRDQLFNDFECILVDDGSPDSSGTICDEYAANDSRFRVIHKENGGLVSAWKAGVVVAQGEYIGFVDSDDYLDKDYYKMLMFDNNNVDIIMGGYTSICDEKKTCVRGSSLPVGIYVGKELETIKKNLYANTTMIANSRWTKLFKKDIITNNIDLIETSITLCEDLCTTYACLMDAKSVKIIDTFGYNYITYDNSMSHGFNVKLIDNFIVVYNTMRRIQSSKDISISIDNELLRQCIIVLIKLISSNLKNKEKKSFMKLYRNNEIISSLINKKSVGFTRAMKILQELFRVKAYSIILVLSTIWNRF